jgi:MFS family permease
MPPVAEPAAAIRTGVRTGTQPFSFLRLLGGTWLSYTTYAVLLAVLPLAELAEGGGPLLATLVVGAPLLAQTLASWGWGWLADRTGTRRAPLVVAIAVQAPLFLTFPVLNAPELFAVRLVQSALFGSVVLATTQATEDPTASSAVRLGRLQLASSGGMLSGIAVAFPLLIRSGFRLDSIGGWELSALLASLTGLSAVVFAAAGELRPSKLPPHPAPLGPKSNPGLFRLAAATAAVSTIRYIPVTAIPVYLADRLGAAGFFGVPMDPTAQLALWLAISSAANLFVSPISGRLADRTGSRQWSMFGFSAVYAVIWTILFLDPSYSVTFAVWILPVSIFLVVATVREAAGQSQADQRGRAVGLLTAAFNLGGLLGGATAGSLLASGTSIPDVFLVAAVGGFGAAFLFLPKLIRLSPPVESVRTTES